MRAPGSAHPRAKTPAVTNAAVIAVLVVLAASLPLAMVGLTPSHAQETQTEPAVQGEVAQEALPAPPIDDGLDQVFLDDRLANDAELLATRSEIAALAAQRGVVDQRIKTLSADVDVLAQRLANLEFTMANQELVIAAAELAQERMVTQQRVVFDEIAVTNAEVAAIRAELQQRAIAAYMSPPDSDAAVYVGSGGMSEIGTRMVLIDVVSASHTDLIDNLELRKNALSANQSTLRALVDQAEQARRDEVDSRDALVAARAEYEQLRAYAEQELAVSSDEAARIAGASLALDQEIDEREAQLRAIAERRAERRARCENTGGTVSDDGTEIDCSWVGSEPEPGSMAWPIFSEVSSGFGMRLHPIHGVERMHEGVDMDGNTGEAIVAAASGQVYFVGWISGYGNTTIIDHGGGVESLYAHQSEFVVDEGTFVEIGSVIGLVGSSGSSTAPHLHFEVLVDGDPVDPMGYLR